MSRQTGSVAACLIVEGRGVDSRPLASLSLDFNGVVGDRHAGMTRTATSREPWYPRGTTIRNDRQVSIVAAEELEAIAAAMALSALDPAWIGANLVVTGIAGLTALPPGTRLFFAGGVTLSVEGENQPCRIAGLSIGARVPDREGLDLLFPKAARHRRGLVATVGKAGTIAVGETFRADPPALHSIHPAEKTAL